MTRFLAFLFLSSTIAVANAQTILKQSSTAQPLVFLMIDSSDHISAKTGLSPTVTLSKSGAAFGSPAGAVTEIANGWYKVAGNATDTGTLGPLILHATGTGADPFDILFEVVSFDPQDSVRAGLTALPNAAAEASGGLYTRGTGAGQINQAANGQIDANAKSINSVSASSVTTVNANIGTTQPENFTGTGASALVKSDAIDVGGTAQTGRDIGASVLLSSGTGTGQISLSSGTVTVGTNNDKSGYSLSVTPPTAATIASAVWQDTTAGDFTTALSIGKSVLNGVTLGTGLTINGYTGNTPQTGDAYARIGAAGAGLTALGDTRIANLDATVSSRMATYAQPTGFLAATFPATVASPTNITAGTITTATNLTNLPSIPANWLTAAGIASGALNGKGDWLLSSGYTTPPTTSAIRTAIWQDLTAGSDFTTSASIGKLLVDDIDATISSRSTYAGGDTSGTTTLLSRLSSGRASNLDNLDAAISTRSTYAGTDTSGTTTLLSRLTNTRAGLLDNLDAAISSRMATFTLPANFSALAITAGGLVDVNDKTGFSLIGAYDPAKVDPWNVTLPSSYTGQKAGYLLWKAGNKP